MTKRTRIALICLRWALGVTFLSAVADRLGLWGPPGSKYASWGDWAHFLAYSKTLNSLLPAALQNPIAILATALETLFGLALITGVRVREAGLGACILLILFAAGMSTAAGIKSPLNYSVFVDAAAAFCCTPPHLERISVEHERLHQPEKIGTNLSVCGTTTLDFG